MNFAYFDCFSGISGDMILGACLDLGIDIEELKKELSKIPIEGYQIKANKVRKQGISGVQVRVIVENEEKANRHLKDILDIIKKSSLKLELQEKGKNIFSRLAKAEALIHNTSVEKNHFHEVGSTDAIIDIMGSLICLDKLNVGYTICSAINVGGGFVRCQHGLLPVPAPATLELLKGVSIYSLGTEKELVTPTGAAIITTLCEEYKNYLPPMKVQGIGYGAGEMDCEIPNLLRIMLAV